MHSVPSESRTAVTLPRGDDFTDSQALTSPSFGFGANICAKKSRSSISSSPSPLPSPSISASTLIKSPSFPSVSTAAGSLHDSVYATPAVNVAGGMDCLGTVAVHRWAGVLRYLVDVEEEDVGEREAEMPSALLSRAWERVW
jgi:hypothetical protein